MGVAPPPITSSDLVAACLLPVLVMSCFTDLKVLDPEEEMLAPGEQNNDSFVMEVKTGKCPLFASLDSESTTRRGFRCWLE